MVLHRSFIPPRFAGGAKPTFKLFSGTNGVDQLNPSLTINGQTVTPDFRYKLGDADAVNLDPWDYGGTLDKEGTSPGATALNQGSPLLGDNDDSVNFAGLSTHYEASNTTDGQLLTEDAVFEAVIKPGLTGVSGAAGTRTTGVGWQFGQSTTRFQLVLEDADATVTIQSDTDLTADTWYHVMVFIDRSGSAQFYVNGIASGGASSLATVTDTLTSGLPMVVGARAAGSSAWDRNIAYLAMWKKASWLDTHLQAACALERFNRLIGIHPNTAKGTATPTEQTRATIAYLDKMEDSDTTRKLYQVGNGWLRNCSRIDSASDILSGYLSETTATNLCLQSEDLNTAPWAKVDAGDTIGGSVVTPNKSTSILSGIIPDATVGAHGVNQPITLTAATYAFTVWAKQGDASWLLIDNDTIANGKVWFNLATGAVGTQQAGITDAHIDDYGDGWYLCHYIFTGTVAAHSLEIRVASADNSTTFAEGDGATIALYAWGAQCELGGLHTSYISTTTGTVTRNGDILNYKGDDGNLGGVGSDLKGTAAWKLLLEDYDNLVTMTMMQISDNQSSADRLVMRVKSTGDFLEWLSAATGGNGGALGGSVDLADGVIHDVRYTWETDNANAYVDGAIDSTPDTSIDIPDDLDVIAIGKRNAADQLNGLISNIRIFKKVTKKG